MKAVTTEPAHKCDIAWLEKHVIALIKEQDRRIELTRDDAAKALQTALAASERRFDLLNEFRKTVEGWAAHYAQQADLAAFIKEQEKTNLRHEQAINRVYGALILIGFIGILNAARLFFP
jgi:hypothetical protein